MLARLTTVLFCTVAPVALFAQSVELRSSDEFISVAGEIVGFNGVMVRVQTNVGQVSVPASEVLCYGAGCNEIIASNDFGLTASAFEGVVTAEVAEQSGTQDDLTVGFGSPIYGTLYRTVTGAYAVTSASSTNVELTAVGELTLQDEATGQSASLTLSAPDTVADIEVGAVSLNGTAPSFYSNPNSWATGTNLTHQLLGLNSFSVVVAPNASITEISISDLARIFAGEVTNWSQIGGADVNILPLQLPPNSVAGAELMKLVMEPAGKEVAGNVLTMSDEAGVAASISQFPGSVSVISTASANGEYVVDVTGSCGIAVAPTNFNIISGDYPLIRPAMASSGAAPRAPLIANVFDFAAGDVAQGLVANEGFVTFSAITQDPAEKNARLSSLLEATLDDAQRVAAAQKFQVLFDADRLSTTMSGGPASGPEGAWNRAMMIDLIEMLEKAPNKGREIIFVGYGASAAGSAQAIAISTATAAQFKALFENVAASTIASGNYTVTSYGFGNVSPSTCIDGHVAGSEYTRVEVWIR
jgi:ABC-type phosphate transport system substrate-binding protein